MARDESRPVTKGQMIMSLASHTKVIRFYSEILGESLKNLKQGCDLLYG
jgi:hypothetical protein